MEIRKFVSRGGEKLAHAVTEFGVDVDGKVCADLGCSTGGFVDCLLQNGAEKVYAVDTAYGVLEWKLRNDQRVIVMERTNALHAEFPEKIDLISIDAGWTKQKLIIPKAVEYLAGSGEIITLVKPHYEIVKSQLVKGRVPDEKVEEVVDQVLNNLQQWATEKAIKLEIKGLLMSPILGGKGKNKEMLAWLKVG